MGSIDIGCKGDKNDTEIDLIIWILEWFVVWCHNVDVISWKKREVCFLDNEASCGNDVTASMIQ